MKFNWGWGIATLYIGFVIMILTLVFKSSRHDVNLVTENYYQQDVEYNSHINKMNNANRLSDGLAIEYDVKSGMLVLNFPDSLGTVTGTVHFYRPSDHTLDTLVAIAPNLDGNRQSINTRALYNGLWRVQVEWKAGQRAFYDEEVIVIENNQAAALGYDY